MQKQRLYMLPFMIAHREFHKNKETMALTFFKTPKNKQFNYKPVYWDKAKEERDKRLKTALEETNKDYAEALRERMDLRWRRSSVTRSRRNSNLRFLAVLMVIGIAFYYIFLS